MNKIVKLSPYLKEAIWGSESWIVSTHENGQSLCNDKKLPFNLNYLIKVIDTHKDLSIQVHPSEENSKNESWLILDHGEGAGIYLGFKEGVTKKEFKNAILAGAQVDKFLNFIPVKKGDFFFIPAGAIHAIGANVKLAEVQESSDTTYRVWDWNRMGLDGKPRELHIEQALEVLDFKYTAPIARNINEMKDLVNNLFEFKGIKIEVLNLMENKSININLSKKNSLTLICGDVDLDGEQFELETSFIGIDDGSINLTSKSNSTIIVVR